MKYLKSLGILLSLFASLTVSANIQLPATFSDHMVLQRDKPVPVWGWADAGEKVTVSFNGQTKTASPDSDRKWMVNLDKIAAGGPYTLIIKGNNTLTINDVYVGEVWLCSGQSNMDMTVAREDCYWAGVINEAQEVANANYPLIRVFDTDFTPSKDLKNDVTGKWFLLKP